MSTYMDVVLSVVRTAPHPISSAEIYERAELDSKATVYSSVNALLKQGKLIVVGEREPDAPQRGKRPDRLYAISPDAVEIDPFDAGEPEGLPPISDIDAELAKALRAQPDPPVVTTDWPDAVEDQPERTDPLRVHQPEPDASIPLMPRQRAASDHGDPILIAIDRLDIRPRIQGAANDIAVLYRLADKIANVGNNPASDIAARLCEIAAKLEAAA